MWIILGVLIAIVFGFLAFSYVWDKKKQKKHRIKKETEKTAANNAIVKVAIWVNLIIDESKEQVKNFIPSIGNHKMSELNNIAKNELKKIKNSELFKAILIDKTLYKTFLEEINSLITINSNRWPKICSKTIIFWKEQEELLVNDKKQKDETKEENQTFKNEKVIEVKKLYD